MSQQVLLATAQGGDERAFAQLVEPYRRELLAHSYRMLGAGADAEDAVQDALLDAWKGLPRFEGRSSLRSWLYTVTTNACLKVIRQRPKRVLPIDYGPPADPHVRTGEPVTESVWIEPYPDEHLRYEERETVELAFVAALQLLPARQRAALLLRDVLGFSAREAGEILETTPASIDSALQRAHKTVESRLPAQSQQATLSSLGDEGLRELVDRFVQAWEKADVGALVAMLSDDARFTMPPQREWYAGRDAIALFLATQPLRAGHRWRAMPLTANGQLALAQYISLSESEPYTAAAICVLTLDGGQIAEATAFRMPEVFARFGLPDTLSD